LVTADHGNAEMLIDPATGGPHTAHTTNPVPFLYITDEGNTPTLRADGSLRDISPTMLSLLNLDQPNQMTGGNLRHDSTQRKAEKTSTATNGRTTEKDVVDKS